MVLLRKYGIWLGANMFKRFDDLKGSLGGWVFLDALTGISEESRTKADTSSWRNRCALGLLGALGRFWPFDGLASRRTDIPHNGQAPQIDRTSKGHGAPSNARVVRDIAIKHHQLAGLDGDLGGAMDEFGFGIGFQEHKGDLVHGELAAVVVTVDVLSGGARNLGDGDRAKLFGSHLRAGHIKKLPGDGRVEGGGANGSVDSLPPSRNARAGDTEGFVEHLLCSFPVDVDGSKVLDLVGAEEVRISVDRGG
mmetsp:Transcript_21762/g.51398  ORF Transcript_21762/g.51398 Transcript_21762/m.51398 type:complete len:251 (-) Transcript_21762:189-941(-)